VGRRIGPVALGEQLGRVVVGVRLDVLREGEDDGAGVDRVGEHPHGLWQGGQELLGPGDAVKKRATGPEGVVDRVSASIGCWSCCRTGPWRRVA
jgi:hypothetical protein